MLILIMVLFFLCWAPILTFNLLAAFELLGSDNMGAGTSTKNIKTAVSLLSYSNRYSTVQCTALQMGWNQYSSYFWEGWFIV